MVLAVACEIVRRMLAVEMLIANSAAYDGKAILMIPKGILAEAMPPPGAPGLYSFRGSRRRIRYSEIAHNRCAQSI